MSDSDKPATAERQTQLQPTDSTAKMDDSSSAIEKRKVIALETAIKAIPILTQDNFTAWKQRVLNFLENLKAKDVFVKGEGKLSTDDELFIRTIITARLDASVQANVINNQNATNVLLIWEAIINYFASEESANRARIWDEFTYYNFDESDITGFITRIKSSIEKMHEVGIQIDTDIVAYEILKKFPKTTEMNAMKTAITHTPGRITPAVVLDHLRTHGHNLTLGGRSKISSSTQVSLFSDPSKKCKPNAHNTLAPHPKDRCYMLYPHLRPPPGSNYQGQKPRAENSVSSFHSSLSHPSSNFILDSGSSAHMTSNLNLFFAIKFQEDGIVRTSSGAESLKIKGIGSIKLTNELGDIILHNVLFVPDIAVNLLSVHCLVLDGYQVHFEINSFFISKNDSVIIKGRYESNLPTIKFSNLSHNCFFTSSELLHKSLGHVSYRRIRQRLGIPLKDFSTCEACAVAKITKGSFHTRHSTASKPFEEIHLDIVGPISPSSREGHRYFLTVVDSCTRFCAAIPLRSKSDVAESIAQAIDLESRRFGYYPTVIHSDRGTEFINKHLLDFCNKHLIRVRYSDAYTPQQNGLAERFNRTILESVRAILKDSGLNKRLWNEVVKASTLTLNQIPAHKSKKSPFELFKN